MIKMIPFLLILLLNFGWAQASLPESTMKDIEIFSKKTLNEKTDLEEVKSKIETLLVLENEDPSRTAVHMLSKSYTLHSLLYDKAFKSIETEKNKKQLTEIKQILKNFYKKGNG